MFNCGLANIRAIIYAVTGKKKKQRERERETGNLSSFHLINPLI
jgi:hypothetical protein